MRQTAATVRKIVSYDADTPRKCLARATNKQYSNFHTVTGTYVKIADGAPLERLLGAFLEPVGERKRSVALHFQVVRAV